MSRIHAVALFIAFPLSISAAAQHGPASDLTDLARGADRVVLATVTRVDAVFQVNEFGDELIVSRAHLRVDGVLKRSSRPTADGEPLVIEVEGGTIGDLTLAVSDLPRLARGMRAVMFLRPDRRGILVPHGRGAGILELDASDRVKGTGVTLSAVRQAVERAGPQ